MIYTREDPELALERRRVKIRKLLEWHSHFVIRPVKISEHSWAFCQVVQRKLNYRAREVAMESSWMRRHWFEYRTHKQALEEAAKGTYNPNTDSYV